jgi:CDP-paratose 2-epimerase
MLTVAQKHPRNVLIIGGGGFIGSNLASHFLAATDARIILFDDLSRPGSEDNIAWLRTQGSSARLRLIRGDVRHSARVTEACRTADEIYHCAARCGGTSASDLRADYAVTVSGTINVLEAAVRSGRKPMVFFASTSKVYGTPNGIAVERHGSRYRPVDPGFCGISEQAPLDLHSPFISIKGAAEKYVCHYAREFDLPAVVFRLGTIAGPRQFPAKAGAWIARLVDAALSSSTITVHGDGLQVRDVLHVADLVDAIAAARAYIGVVAGNVYNVAGGLSNSTSIQEMIRLVECTCHSTPRVHHVAHSMRDQMLDILDSSAFSAVTGWMPRRTLEQTLRDVSASWHATHRVQPAQSPQLNLEILRVAA